MTKGSGRVGRPPGPRPASARDVGRSDVRQFFPLAHLAPIFTQPMGGSSTQNTAAGSSSEPIVISDPPSSAPTAAPARAAVLDTLGQFMEDYGSSDEDKPAEVGQDVDPEPVTTTTETTQVNVDRMAQLRDTWTFKVRISLTSTEYATIVLPDDDIVQLERLRKRLASRTKATQSSFDEKDKSFLLSVLDKIDGK